MAKPKDDYDPGFALGIHSGVVDPQIPGYRVEGLIGSGGMASVYLAIQESLERPVALKVLDDPESPEYQERFLNEGRIVASLTHANIITVHDIGVAARHLYISMEYVEGGDLRRKIRSGMTPEEAFHIVERIGSALLLAHSRGVIHRDVKPANILFRTDGTPLLADFGIAKDHHSDSGLTMDGSVVGSPYYLSPELARAQPIDGRADIYSLGIILYEMLVGEKPFKGESAVDTIFKHLNEPPPELPEELVRLQYFLDKMLAKIPTGRFADMGALLDEVHALQARGFDDIANRVVRSTETTLAFDKAKLVKASRKKRSGLGRALRAAGLAAGLGALAVGAWHYLAPWPNFLLGTRDGADTTAQMAAPRAVSTPTKPANPALVVESVRPKTKGASAPVADTGVEQARAEPAHVRRSSAPKKKVQQASKPAAREKPRTQTTAKVEPKPVAARPRKSVRQQEIEYLAGHARQRLREGKLDEPFGDNAVFYRDELMRVAPRSAVVSRISFDIAERYRQRAEREIEAGDFLAARESVDNGLRIRPDHKRLRQLKDNALKEYSRQWAHGLFDDLKRSFTGDRSTPTRKSTSGPDQ